MLFTRLTDCHSRSCTLFKVCIHLVDVNSLCMCRPSSDVVSPVQNMLAMLQQQYPPGLMPDLAQQTQGCLQDMTDAFPNADNVATQHLHSLVSCVESLLRISDYQRRRVLHHMKRNKSEAGYALQQIFSHQSVMKSHLEGACPHACKHMYQDK